MPRVMKHSLNHSTRFHCLALTKGIRSYHFKQLQKLGKNWTSGALRVKLWIVMFAENLRHIRQVLRSILNILQLEGNSGKIGKAMAQLERTAHVKRSVPLNSWRKNTQNGFVLSSTPLLGTCKVFSLGVFDKFSLHATILKMNWCKRWRASTKEASRFPRSRGAKDQEVQTNVPPFRYLSHVRNYLTFMFGGSEGSRVATVAFLRN
ncbi:hypothetical protein Scep_027921 [Stephania cephalantha]|uniref:Uncharacterized protein n=1 Tax=Stephania cephalantha TaxID=152367 RepID=A0AAP0EHA5_9MAGN